MSDSKRFYTSEPMILIGAACLVLYFWPGPITLFLCTVVALYKLLER